MIHGIGVTIGQLSVPTGTTEVTQPRVSRMTFANSAILLSLEIFLESRIPESAHALMIVSFT